MNVMTNEHSPAEIYDGKFVPALFGPWGPVVAEAAGIGRGKRVLDVACGTGALTLAALDRVGSQGQVVGLDANPDMLTVARRKTDAIQWQEGLAEKLPFESDSFDAVISQFAFMFFEDRSKAMREMMRVLKPGGHLLVAVCGAVERSPGYATFAQLLDRLFGKEVGNSFRAPFVLGDPEELRRIAEEAGIKGAGVEERFGSVRFSTIDELVSTERACVWTLGGILDPEQFDTLLQESKKVLQPFTGPDGRVTFDMPALFLGARKAA